MLSSDPDQGKYLNLTRAMLPRDLHYRLAIHALAMTFAFLSLLSLLFIFIIIKSGAIVQESDTQV